MTMLRHAHAAPPGAVRPDRAGGVAVRHGRGDGPDLPREGDEHRAPVRDLRVPGAHAGTAGAAARSRHLDGRDGAGDGALPAELSSPGARARARATSPGSCSAVRTTTGSSTRRPCPRRSVRWVVAAAVIGLVAAARPRHRGASGCSLCWIAVPVVFFELWPVKGFQYLLPIVGAAWPCSAARRRSSRGADAAGCSRVRVRDACSSLTIGRLDGHRRPEPMLAGSGGVPAGREAGEWIDGQRAARGDVHDDRPVDGEHRPVLRAPQGVRAVGEPEPAQPQPVLRADRPTRTRRSATASIQYVVWDTFSAARARLLGPLLGYAERYNGRAVHAETLPRRTPRRAHGAQAGDRRLRGAAVRVRRATLPRAR